MRADISQNMAVFGQKLAKRESAHHETPREKNKKD